MNDPIQWQKSSYSGGNGPNCIELAHHDGSILLRESDTPGIVITTDRSKLAAFVREVKAGEFDHLLG